VLRGSAGGYTINEVALTYYQQQKLAQEVIKQLASAPQQFADEASWQ
jgi:hypothetical protein